MADFQPAIDAAFTPEALKRAAAQARELVTARVASSPDDAAPLVEALGRIVGDAGEAADGDPVGMMAGLVAVLRSMKAWAFVAVALRAEQNAEVPIHELSPEDQERAMFEAMGELAELFIANDWDA